tara:strand:+ start:1781 stop:2191 length:411 start_codon:yes stop_codon:yes gene_type:complete
MDSFTGLIFKKETKSLMIDVIPLLNNKKGKENFNNLLLDFFKKIEKDIEFIYLFVSKKYTISMFERELELVKFLVKYFYTAEINLKKCYILNTPSTFNTMFKILKPMLTKKALELIQLEKNVENISQIYNSDVKAL